MDNETPDETDAEPGRDVLTEPVLTGQLVFNDPRPWITTERRPPMTDASDADDADAEPDEQAVEGGDRPVLEALAALEHRQWVYWTQNLAEREDLPDHLIERWERQWVDYADLDEDAKEHDRKWARQVLELLEEHPAGEGP